MSGDAARGRVGTAVPFEKFQILIHAFCLYTSKRRRTYTFPGSLFTFLFIHPYTLLIHPNILLSISA